ncbi:MAG TPA: FAD-dependent oxidoreductase, partial [Oceanobacillus sp.]|nr:FAD-dependent oxidoreductase [Oceanobacillus sp.]
MPETIVVIGNGMVGHKFVELLLERDTRYQVIIFGEEPRTAYDRVHLSDYFSDKTEADLLLATPEVYRQNGVQIFTGDPVIQIDRKAKKITSANGIVIRYDKLVLATGSYPFIPPIPGKETMGTFVYRTIDDLEAIKAYARNAHVGAVLGGGLLGLECANALKRLGLETHVIEFTSRLMPVQVDELGGKVLRQKIEALGV